MKGRLLYLAVTCLVFLIAGQAGASSITAKISPEYAPNTVIKGDPFFVDIYLQNEYFEQVGLSIPFYFYSPDGSISNVTHRNVQGSVVFDWRLQDTLRDSSITTKNGWMDYWLIIKQFYGFSWDGALPDTINFTGASVFGWVVEAAPVNYYSFAYQIDEAGTFCIDSCTVPGVDPEGKFDWLFDDATFNFSGPYCFTVLDTTQPENQAPVLVDIGDKEIDEGAELTFGVSASDPDGTYPALTTSTLPEGAGFTDNGDGTGTFNWTPTFEQSGDYPVTFYASDGELDDEETITITVNNVNRPPVFADVDPQSTDENAELIFNVSASDADGAIPALTATIPEGAGFTDNGDGTGTFTWTPTYDQAGDYTAIFYASDGTKMDTLEVSITVNNVNRAPEFAAVDPQTTDENVELTFNVTVADPDGETPEITADIPDGASFVDNGDGTGTFTWTPDYDQAGDYTVIFYATDGDLTDELEVSVTVNDVNRAPVLENVPVGVQYVYEEGLLVIPASASDPDGTIPTLTTGGLYENMTFVDSGNGHGVFEFRPDTTQVGDYTIMFIASDGQLADSESVYITVQDVEAPIELSVDTATLTYTLTAGQMMLDSIYVIEKGGREISFALTGSDDWIVTTDTVFQTPGYGLFVINAEMLDEGHYEGTLTIDAAEATNSPIVIPVTLDVEAAVITELATTPTEFIYTITPTDTISDYLVVYETHGQNVEFHYSNSEAWLNLVILPEAPVTPDTIGFYITPGLAIGTYYDTIVITMDVEPNNTPLRVPVTLTIEEAPVTELAASPDHYDFTLMEGDSTYGSIFVYELSDRHVEFTVSNKSSWMTLPDYSLNPVTPESVPIYINSAGLAAGTYYDTVTVMALDGSGSTIYVPVMLTVTSALAELATLPEYFTYVLNVGDTLSDSVHIYEMSDGNIPITYSNSSDWLMLPDTDIVYATPFTVQFMVDATSLEPGDYYDTIVVVSDEASNSPLFVPVMLTVTSALSELATLPEYFDYTLNADYMLIDSLYIYEVSDRNIIGTYYHSSDWLIMDTDIVFETPITIHFTVDATSLEPGDYYDTIVVMSDEAFNSPLFVPVKLTVEGQPEYQLAVSPLYFNRTLTQGMTAYDSLLVYEASGANIGIAFANMSSWLSTWTFSYVTPTSLVLMVNTSMLAPGSYADTIFIIQEMSPAADTVKVPYYLTVEPSGPVSEDSVWVSTVPGVPGSDIIVPVYFRNFEVLQAINLPLIWSSSDIHLNEVTFEGTRVSYVDNKPVVIDNATRRVQIGIVPTFSENVIPGRGLLAKLHFTIQEGATEAFVSIDTTRIIPEGGLTFIDDMLNIIRPTFIPGGVVIDTSTGYICGRVVDTEGNEIEGATVELWDDFPGGGQMLTDITDENGQFACHSSGISPFDAYAYKEGYYPGLVEEIQFGEIGIEIVLSAVPPVTPTQEWVDFYCDDNYFYGVPMPAGSVVDAYDPDGVHCGTYFVTEPGKYGFMLVYRDDFTTDADEGAEPGDEIQFFINGYPANASGDRIWTENGDNMEVCLDIFSVEERTIPLQQGWNLISWNVDTPEDDIETLLESVWDCVDVVLGFEQGGATYDPSLPEFSTLWKTDHFHGYWVKMNCADTLIVTGTPVAATTPIDLELGWNLVSYLPAVEDSTWDALYSIVDTNLIVALGFDGVGQTFDPLLPEYSTLPVMKPGFGYWLKVYYDDQLIYPGIGPVMVFRQTFAHANKVAADCRVTTSRMWMNVYSYGLTLDGVPVATGSEVEIKAADGSVVGYGAIGDGGKFGFVPVYGDDPSTVEREGLKPGEEFILVIDGVETNETFTWSENGGKLELGTLTARTGGGLLPEEFGLSQNYPNPFNPTTTISFSVPSAMSATVEIYNILGEKVRTVFDGIAQPGRNDVIWDGVNENGEAVASGIYFYRMKAGSFNESRKMVLMK
nr:tandem-95 repeat protein [candidate division Zixibacteria bacterium]